MLTLNLQKKIKTQKKGFWVKKKFNVVSLDTVRFSSCGLDPLAFPPAKY